MTARLPVLVSLMRRAAEVAFVTGKGFAEVVRRDSSTLGIDRARDRRASRLVIRHWG